ncbi:hypothetical protein AALA98_02765 [Lachnospiraceae bacterium 45-W7]
MKRFQRKDARDKKGSEFGASMSADLVTEDKKRREMKTLYRFSGDAGNRHANYGRTLKNENTIKSG